MHTAWFRGVDNASAIRELIQARLRALKNSGLGDRDEAVTTVRLPDLAGSSQFLDALRAVAAEASALRTAVGTR